jgi:hypothetical protein
MKKGLTENWEGFALLNSGNEIKGKTFNNSEISQQKIDTSKAS